MASPLLEAQLSGILKLCKTRKTTSRLGTQTRSGKQGEDGGDEGGGRGGGGGDGGGEKERYGWEGPAKGLSKLLRYLNEATFQP